MEFFIIAIFVYYIIFITVIRVFLFYYLNIKKVDRGISTSQSLNSHQMNEQMISIVDNDDILPPYTPPVVIHNSISNTIPETFIDIIPSSLSISIEYKGNNNNDIMKSKNISIEEDIE
ncbi:hypothetical protein BCR36DRAFT_466499 [Piromyces finnis]|uniref:Uncharacterized protein n=1 Tax=Piromyces finnis TaxID=1754191 RepID=A0A1Y1UV04_9FUNG|nr:hypothetical protein BCR36DRAFT_466499 [Piromyces finnis]|eukprot:ORX41836.1 hypothetical protein BCR36DRAFT_466499 [Piromyces finnis]